MTVVGDDPDRQKLAQMTDQLGLSENVNYVGYKSQAEVRDYLQQTDVFVLPSLAEGVPVVLMEAMASGVPVVATQVGGVSELVDSGVNGYLVPPSDVAALTEHIEKLLNDHKLRAAFGTASRAKVERDFNIRYEVSRLHCVMTRALAGHVEPIRPNYHDPQVFTTGSELGTISKE